MRNSGRGPIALLGICLLVGLAAVAGPKSIAEIDVSGRPGADPEDGYSLTDKKAAIGKNGRHAGNAGPSNPGQGAGRIAVELSQDGAPHRGSFVLSGVLTDPDGNSRTANSVLKITSGDLILRADGGKGGRGGYGGDGEAGGNGSKGSDANRLFEAGNGGDGGDGGRGGDGTRGAVGGAGGQQTISARVKDMHLFLLTKATANGGLPGDAGRNGEGGKGGSGGSGGSGCTWTTTEDYTDAQGKRQTKTEWHSRGAGTDGSKGRSGADGSGDVSPGSFGPDGSVTYNVICDDNRVESYDSIYKLAVQSFTVVGQYGNKFLEPGEPVKVTRIVVKNIGSMPTPANVSSQVLLAANGWILSDAVPLSVPRSLKANEEFVFDSDIDFQIKDTKIVKAADRLAEIQTVQPETRLDVLERLYEHNQPITNVTVQFPVEIEVLSTLPSLAPGERARMLLKIKNISGHAIGSESELKRRLNLQFESSGGDLSVDNLVFMTPQGDVDNLSKTMFQAIANLGAGETRLLEGIVGLTADAPSFKEVGVRVSMNLDSPNRSEARTTSIQELTLRVAKKADIRSDSDIVLVTNSGIPSAAMTAWLEAADKLGLKYTVWDLSYETHLDLLRSVDEGSELFRSMRGKTVVILNNGFSTGAVAANPSHFIAQKDFYNMLGAFGMNVLLVGKDQQSSLTAWFEQYLVPDAEGIRTEYPDLQKLLKDYDVNNLGIVSLESDQIQEFRVRGTTLWGTPKQKSLVKMAESVRRKLMPTEVDPNSVVVWKFDPQQKGKSWGLFKEWDLGTIEVRRMLGDSARKAVGLDVESDSVTSAEAVRKEVGLKALSLVLRFEDKRDKMMDFLLANDKNSASVMADALMVDLADEVLESAESISRNAVKDVKFEMALKRLDILLETRVVEPTADQKEFLIDLFARVFHLYESQSGYWSRNWWGNEFTSLSDNAAGRIRSYISTQFDVTFKGAVKRWWGSIRGTPVSEEQKLFDQRIQKLRASKVSAKSETFRSAVLMGVRPKGAAAIAGVIGRTQVVQARDVKERVASQTHSFESTQKSEALSAANSARAGQMQTETKRQRQELLLSPNGPVCQALLQKTQAQ